MKIMNGEQTIFFNTHPRARILHGDACTRQQKKNCKPDTPAFFLVKIKKRWYAVQFEMHQFSPSELCTKQQKQIFKPDTPVFTE
jgi:hypothetical protein